MVKSVWAWAAAASAACTAPITVPGGNPVTAVPGLTPSPPVITVAPVLVTVELARTPKFAAVPSGTGNWALRQTENVSQSRSALYLLTKRRFPGISYLAHMRPCRQQFSDLWRSLQSGSGPTHELSIRHPLLNQSGQR